MLDAVYVATGDVGEKTSSDKQTNVVWPYYDESINDPATARKGLVPISTIGEMNTDTGKMKIFEKASFTPTAGGYRLIASQINNYNYNDGTAVDYANQTQKGYVAFDLFGKNITGSHYNKALNGKDEEAIYLTTDSAIY